MQSPVAWNLSRHKPDHPAPGLFFPAPTLRSRFFAFKGEEKMREQPPPPPTSCTNTHFHLHIKCPTISIPSKWDLGVGEVGSVEHYTTDIPSLTSPFHKHFWRPQMACFASAFPLSLPLFMLPPLLECLPYFFTD